MSTNGKVENGENSYSSFSPSVQNGRPVARNAHESWCHVESSDQNPELRSQRRHYKDFNRSSVFEFASPQSPVEEIKTIDPDQQVNQKHKQKRHYDNKNESTLDL